VAITCNIWTQIALRRFCVSNLVLGASQISVGISLHLLELNLVKFITVNFTFHINTIVKTINWPVAYLGFGKGGPWRASGARVYNGGLGAEPPAGSRGRAPGRGVRGRSPLKLKHFLLLNVQWKPQIRPFFLKFGNAKDHQTLFNFAILAGKWQKTHLFIQSRL